MLTVHRFHVRHGGNEDETEQVLEKENSTLCSVGNGRISGFACRREAFDVESQIDSRN